jgi:adenylate kinase
MNLILIGPPGSGKGTQAEVLQAEAGLTHIASGDLFRSNINQQTELGKLAQSYITKGNLVPDEITIGMVRDRLAQPDTEVGVLFDGFPRTIPQADALTELLGNAGRHIDAVLELQVSDDEIVRRLAGRLICRECQTPFHKVFKPFESCPEHRCNGEHLYQRDDDKPETVRARIDVFRKQTSPLISYYQDRGLLKPIPGEKSPTDVSKLVLAAIADF